MKITAVTPNAAAANPSHPDHARWVKEQTLKIETNHARSVGLSLRDAETNNIIQLERLANRKRRPRAAKKPRKDITPDLLASSGVTVRPAKARKLAPLPPCKLCKRCVWCKRSLRMSQIATRSRQQDARAVALMHELTAIMFAANRGRDYKDSLSRELPFSRITGRDVDKAVTQGIEWVCDRSVSFMGQWR